MRELSTKLITAELGQAIAIGGVVVTSQRVVVVSGDEVVASFQARSLRSLAVVDGFASRHPVREAVWGVGFMVLGLVRVLIATHWWERAAFSVMALVGVWVSLNLLKRTTLVRLRHDSGQTTTLMAGVRLPKDEIASLRRRLAEELGLRVV